MGESMGGGQKVEYYSLYLHIVECTTNSLLHCVGSGDAQVHEQDCFRLYSVSCVHHMHHWLSIWYVCYTVHFSYSNSHWLHLSFGHPFSINSTVNNCRSSTPTTCILKENSGTASSHVVRSILDPLLSASPILTLAISPLAGV